MTHYNHYTKATELIIQTLTNMKELPPDLPELVHEGPLFKRGQRNSWKERWFVLFSNYQLLYYLDQNESNKATNLCGWVDLHDVWMINAKSTEPSITNLIPSFMKPSVENKSKKKKKSLEIGRKNKNTKNKSKEEHEITFITSTDNINLKTSNGESFLKWILYLNKFVFDNRASILYQGWLWKKSERKRRQWKKRWIVIENYTKAITYYEDQTRSNFRHFIALADIVDDINIVHPHKTYQYGFTMTTLERNYTFGSTDKIEINKWLEIIKAGRIEVLAEIEEDEKHSSEQSISPSLDEYNEQGDSDSSDDDSDSDSSDSRQHIFGKKKLTIAGLTDLVLHKNSSTPSVDYIEEKIEILSGHQYSVSQMDADEITFDFDPNQLEWLKEHNMLHTGHLSARKNRALHGEMIKPWQPQNQVNMEIKQDNFDVRPWSPWNTNSNITSNTNHTRGIRNVSVNTRPKPPPPPPKKHYKNTQSMPGFGGNDIHMFKIHGTDKYAKKSLPKPPPKRKVEHKVKYKLSHVEEHIQKDTKVEIDKSNNIKPRKMNKIVKTPVKKINDEMKMNSKKKGKIKGKKMHGRSSSGIAKKKDKSVFKTGNIGKKYKNSKEHKRASSINSIKTQSKSMFSVPKMPNISDLTNDKRSQSITPKKKNKSSFKVKDMNSKKRTSLPSIKSKKNKDKNNYKITPKKKEKPLPKSKKRDSKIGMTPKKNKDKPIGKKRDSKIGITLKKNKNKNKDKDDNIKVINKKRNSKIGMTSKKNINKNKKVKDNNVNKSINKKRDTPSKSVKGKSSNEMDTPMGINDKINGNKKEKEKEKELISKYKKQKTVKFDEKIIEKDSKNVQKKRHRKTGSRNSRTAHRRKGSKRKKSTKTSDEELLSNVPPSEQIQQWKCASCYFMNRHIFINDRGFAKWRDNCLLCGRIKREFNSLSNLSKTHLTNNENDENQNGLNNKLLAEWKCINILHNNNGNDTHIRGGNSYSSSSSLSFTSQTLCKSHYIDCMNIKRLIFIMKYFNEFTIKIINNGKYNHNELTLNDFFEYITDYDIADLFFDLYHCFQLHWNKFLIALFKTKITQCESNNKCIHFRRNYRERSKCVNNNYRFKLYLTSDNNEISIIQILDSIHCLMFHDISMNIENKYQKKDYINNEQKTNNDFKLKMMKTRRNMLSDHHLNKLLMDNCDLKKISKKSKYLLSTKEDMNSDNFSGINNQKYKWATRTSMDYLYLKPNHPNIFTELTCNPLNPLSIEQWNTELRKAKHYLNMNPMQNNIKTNGSKKYLREWGLQYSKPLGIEHIIVIMIYCNYTEFTLSFRKLHRKLQEKDTNEIISTRHSQIYYWFGRFLTESIQFYGYTMNDNILLYHSSTNIILFNYFDTQYKYPTITTSSSLIAQTFIGENGVILEISAKFNGYLNQTKYLDIMFLSDFKDERECLCFAHSDNLLINDIITIHTNTNKNIILNRHKKWLKCLNFFQQICSGNTINNNCFYLNDIKDNTINLLKILIENQIKINKNNQKIINNKEIPNFIQTLFHYYCVTKKGESPYAKFDMSRKYIDIGCIQDEWDDIYEKYFDTQNKILKIFPNIKQFRVMDDIRSGMETPQFGYLSSAKFSNRSSASNSLGLLNLSNVDSEQIFFPANT